MRYIAQCPWKYGIGIAERSGEVMNMEMGRGTLGIRYLAIQNWAPNMPLPLPVMVVTQNLSETKLIQMTNEISHFIK